MKTMRHPLFISAKAALNRRTSTRSPNTFRRESIEAVEGRHPGFAEGTSDRKLRIKRVANELIKSCINDLITSSTERLAASGVDSPEAARALGVTSIEHSPEVRAKVRSLQAFLYRRFYRHEHLRRFSEYARKVLTGLFEFLVARPAEMPAWYRTWSEEVGVERAACDYLAGMTDRFAEREFERIA